MTLEMLLVFTILGVTIFLFVLDRIRLDLVAMLSLLALLLTDILTPTEALAGFSDPIILIIAGLFVVGGGLFRTGVAGAMGQWLSRLAGTNPIVLTVVIMLVVAFLSAFMSSTGATAVLVPVVVTIAWNAKISPSKLLMPLSFGALFGGMMTLLGTPPNLIANTQLIEHGLEPFGFFTFTPFALVALAAGILFMALVGYHLLPKRDDDQLNAQTDAPTLDELARVYELPEHLHTLRVCAPSSMANQTVVQSDIGARYGVNILEVQSPAVSRFSGNTRPNGNAQSNGNGEALANGAVNTGSSKQALAQSRPVDSDTILRVNDLLHVQGEPDDVQRMAAAEHLQICAEQEPHRLLSKQLGLAEIMPTPDSQILGHTLQELRFRTVYGLTAIGIRRMARPLDEDPATVKLRFGDTLLVEGPWERIERLQKERRNLVVVGLPKEMAEAGHATERASLAVAIMVGMLLLITLDLLPMVTAVLLAAVAMVLTGCLRAELLYRTISWESIVLIAAMLPMATALQKTGGVEFIAHMLTNNIGAYGPLAVLAGVFLITTLSTQFLSNTATSVLMAPIAYQAAVTLGVAPHAFLMAVAMAASSAFMTPIASPVNTIVLAAGGYRFSDFVKVGLPLLFIMLVLVVTILPILFPL
jgi:di/tricarboxylate transporter